MEFISVFDVIGPNMIGPSSSHTAGVVSIALMARRMFARPIKKARFTLYGSFAKTYRGHGTDRALLGGTMGFATDDVRIRDAFSIAEQQGLAYEYVIDGEATVNHPNTVDILLESEDGHKLKVRGNSIGGGKIRIARIDDIRVDFTGEYDTLIIRQDDVPGILVHITRVLSDHDVNVAFMRLFREEKGGRAFTIVESDASIPQSIIEEIKDHEHIEDIMLVSANLI